MANGSVRKRYLRKQYARLIAEKEEFYAQKNGAYGIRTRDLLNAIQTRSQLR